jgi:hypothetical protein
MVVVFVIVLPTSQILEMFLQLHTSFNVNVE